MLSSAEHLRGAESEEMNELETWRCCDMRELRGWQGHVRGPGGARCTQSDKIEGSRPTLVTVRTRTRRNSPPAGVYIWAHAFQKAPKVS